MLVAFTVHDASGFCRDLPDLIAHARAGIHAHAQVPPSGVVDAALRPHHLAELATMCDDLEAAYEKAVEDVHATWKRERRDRRRRERESA